MILSTTGLAGEVTHPNTARMYIHRHKLYATR